MADAVFYLKKAAASASDDEYRLELAKTLSTVSQFDQSNMIYLKMLAEGNKTEKCCFGLSQNLYFQSDMEHSMYYLNIYMDKYSNFPTEEDEEEYIEIVEENDFYEGYNIVYPPEMTDMTELINHARALMKQGEFEKAVKLLKKVPEGNYDYIYALNNIALCCFFLNDFEGTKKYSQMVLFKNQKDVFALCNLAAMYNYIDDNENAEKYLKRVLAINVSDISDLFKIATTLCEMKEHSLAAKYLNMILTQKPYDTNIMFLTAIAYYNTGKTQAAIDIFLQLNKLNENDYAVKYYLKLIRKAEKEKAEGQDFFQPLEYICQLPYGETSRRLKTLKNLKSEDIKKYADSEEFYQLCSWCFSMADNSTCKSLVQKLTSCKNPAAAEFLRERLLDPLTDEIIKSFIIERFILKGLKPPYDISADYIVKKLNPHIIKTDNKSRALYKAYALAYSRFMTFLPDIIEEDLYLSYTKLQNIFKNKEEYRDIKTLAAVIAYKSRGKMDKIKENIIGLFKAEEKLFDRYVNAAEENIDD